MSFKLVGGRAILETVGPSCHLVGELRRDTRFPNQLILTRNADALSLEVRALKGRWLRTLKVTDPIGKTATISHVTFVDLKPVQSSVVKPGYRPQSGHSERDSSALENVSFTFQSITVENLNSSTSTAEDIIGWPPP
jgi:hypothetical protein